MMKEKSHWNIVLGNQVPDRVRKVRVKKAAVNRAKKQRVAVDESVELSSRAIKQVSCLSACPLFCHLI